MKSEKKIVNQKNLEGKTFFDQTNLGQKKCWVSENFGTKNFVLEKFESKKDVVQKN